MKQRIALGSTLLLTLSTAVAGTFLYGQDISTGRVGSAATASAVPNSTSVEATPEMIAAWKSTALATDYMPPKLPI